MYSSCVTNPTDDDSICVDLRSDTLTRPTSAMRDAMKTARVGDDVFGEDPTVIALERMACELLGKQSAVFVPTGTMANLIAIMVHCPRRGSEAIVGDASHTYLFEQAGAAQIAGVQLVIIPNRADGTFDLQHVRERVRVNPDVHEPHTDLVVVEDTHNMCGGKVLPLAWLRELRELTSEHGIKVHMDGARLFNAAVALDVDVATIVQHVDTVCFCLSKGLGAPVGSVLVGPNDFICEARRMRKVLGGGMRQCGVLAAAGIVALNEIRPVLGRDHARIKRIAEAIARLNSAIFRVDDAQTNILMVRLDATRVRGSVFVARMSRVTDAEANALGVRVVVKLCCRNESWVRVTLYHEITDADVELVVRKMVYVMRELESEMW